MTASPLLWGQRRPLHYQAVADAFEVRDGWGRYGRPLYGSPSNFRIETSDRPLFAAYDKGRGRNLSLALTVGGHRVALDSTTHCTMRYRGGRVSYVLTHDGWRGGTLLVEVLAEHEGEHALWQITPRGFRRQEVRLTAVLRPIAKTKMKRNGDLGIDARSCFDPLTPCPDSLVVTIDTPLALPVTLRLTHQDSLTVLSSKEARARWESTASYYTALASQVTFDTPEPLINAAAPALMAAADGLWDGDTWQHGCVGWRTPLAGWRGAYVGDVVGWYERATHHFLAYQESMVTDLPPVRPHPAQDTTKHLARSAEQWGTPMYSNGYICKLPHNNRKMSHYDMNLNYVDELLWHFQYEADTALMRRFWLTLQLHHAWERRNWDPDGDHLYDGYCCIWASDALYYNSGAVTHSSAYNYRANLLTARIATLLGEDATPYQEEAAAILQAMQERLWVDREGDVPGHWAEFQDFMGHRRLHKAAALWSVYTPIDCGVSSPEQAFQTTRYMEQCLPHIPMCIAGRTDTLYTVSTSDWMPYAWSTNNVAHEEVAHGALAAFLAGESDTGYQLLYADLLDEMCAGYCPGNFGQISHYDKAIREAYRDFGDNIGITARALVQGLFGIRPEALFGRCVLQPGFPRQWTHAAVHTPYLSYRYYQENGRHIFEVEQHFRTPLSIVLRLPLRNATYREITGSSAKTQRFVIDKEDWLIMETEKPRRVRPTLSAEKLGLADLAPASEERHTYVNLNGWFNASADTLYKEQYLSPRSPYTTLALPSQGMGDWCVPLMTAEINDDGFREKIDENGRFDTALGLHFASPKRGHNVVYTSLWDNFPTEANITLSAAEQGSYCAAYLLLCGSTNNMQSRIENARLIAHYTDGASDTLLLINPYNWCTIEQDYYYDEYAFWSLPEVPYRVHFATGLTSRTLKADLMAQGLDTGVANIHVTDFDIDTPIARGMSLPDGAAEILKMPLQSARSVERFSLETLSNDIVVGLMAITLEK